MCVCVYTCGHVCSHVSMYECAHACANVCVYVHACEHSHMFISRVPDQSGVSQVCYIVEIYHSGLEPSISL